jgi:hypothetical protein
MRKKAGKFIDSKDWIVRVYNEDNKVIVKWIIKDRTESEAQSEAENEMDRISQREDYDDWTMMPYKKKTKKK